MPHLHAGGFFVGAPDGQDNFLRYVADRADAVDFDLDYSLSPERHGARLPRQPLPITQ
ncbi:MAG: alpha/beta hydrolase fold domain-containing protein [Mycetocola sp.]